MRKVNYKQIAEIHYNLILLRNHFQFKDNEKGFFIRFLKEHGIYRKFLYEVKKQNKVHILENFLKGYNFREGINLCITWCETKDGRDFWSFYYKLYLNTMLNVYSPLITKKEFEYMLKSI